MKPRGPISFLVALALVAAMLYPMPLHRCHGAALPGIFQAGSMSDEAVGASCCGVDLSACRCNHRGEKDASTDAPRSALSIERSVAAALLPAGDCGCISVPQIAIDAAVLIAPHNVVVPDAAFAPALPGIIHCAVPVSVRIAHTGSSPPYLAARDHYTYLRTATLLI